VFYRGNKIWVRVWVRMNYGVQVKQMDGHLKYRSTMYTYN